MYALAKKAYMLQTDPQRICLIALERLESLFESWCESRHATRAQITNSLLLNVRLIVLYGSAEDIALMIEYMEHFDEALKPHIDGIRLVLKQKISNTLH